MGSDMYMNPPTAEECRNWAGHGIAVNLTTGQVIKKQSTKKPMPEGFKWLDDVNTVEMVNAFSKIIADLKKENYNLRKN